MAVPGRTDEVIESVEWFAHAAAKATEAAAPEATEAATAAPRRIAGTPTRYEPPLTFLLRRVTSCREQIDLAHR
jgi:hypothetical protein